MWRMVVYTSKVGMDGRTLRPQKNGTYVDKSSLSARRAQRHGNSGKQLRTCWMIPVSAFMRAPFGQGESGHKWRAISIPWHPCMISPSSKSDLSPHFLNCWCFLFFVFFVSFFPCVVTLTWGKQRRFEAFCALIGLENVNQNHRGRGVTAFSCPCLILETNGTKGVWKNRRKRDRSSLLRRGQKLFKLFLSKIMSCEWKRAACITEDVFERFNCMHSENRRHFQTSHPDASSEALDNLMRCAWEQLSKSEKLKFVQRASNALKDKNKHSNRTTNEGAHTHFDVFGSWTETAGRSALKCKEKIGGSGLKETKAVQQKLAVWTTKEKASGENKWLSFGRGVKLLPPAGMPF